jgi:hypothetical protein
MATRHERAISRGYFPTKMPVAPAREMTPDMTASTVQSMVLMAEK